MKQVSLNGVLILEKDATVSIADKGYFFDFAVYSSLKVIKGHVFFAEYHVDRLLESASIIGMQHTFTKAHILTWLREFVAAEALDDALLRMTFVGDPDFNGGDKLFIFAVGGLTYYPRQYYQRGARVITYHGERRFPQAKSKDLLLSVIAYGEAKKHDALDALLVDRDDTVREGTRTNFYAVRGQTVITPPLDLVLEGITRKMILEAIAGDYEIAEAPIPLASLGSHDEYFISSTSMNVMPIAQIDDRTFDTTFTQTKHIAALFKAHYKKLHKL
jgi:branched-subunit amino acid aminotransferase/4-amino-4-deoxychorismate lyase